MSGKLEITDAGIDLGQLTQRCSYCRKVLPQANVCTKCKCMIYCDRVCQTSDWSEHKGYCNGSLKAIMSAETTAILDVVSHQGVMMLAFGLLYHRSNSKESHLIIKYCATESPEDIVEAEESQYKDTSGPCRTYRAVLEWQPGLPKNSLGNAVLGLKPESVYVTLVGSAPKYEYAGVNASQAQELYMIQSDLIDDLGDGAVTVILNTRGGFAIFKK